MIIDRYNRVHDYLRISLTDNCNLRCFYCMPGEDYVFSAPSKLMQPDEIGYIASIFTNMGVSKIRITGGEPLIRKDAGDIISRLSKLPVQLAMTTNATRLHDFIDVLEQAGMRSINISLDTLKPERFKQITRRDLFSTVWENIHLLLRRNFLVKVNAVVMKDINDDEILDFVEWTKDEPVHLRFIEFMPFDSNRWSGDKVVGWKEIMEKIESRYEVIGLTNGIHDTDKKYRVNGHAGTFAVISTMTAPFCSGCNRIRLTADGKMKNCLFSKTETDLLTPLRQGRDIASLIKDNIQAKAWELGGQFSTDLGLINPNDIHNRSMISIGG